MTLWRDCEIKEKASTMEHCLISLSCHINTYCRMVHILLKKISDKSACTESYSYTSKVGLETVTFCSNAPAGPKWFTS
jgi:hypothetical protein